MLDQFRAIGLQNVTTEEYPVSVPMDKGASLKVLGTGETMRLYGLWPNLARTPSLPRDGLRGKLIYGRGGDFADFNGRDVKGRVVLMDFNTKNNWLNPCMLGAKAIVFVEPDSTVYLEAEDKFLTVPLSVPRFWLGKEDARHLLSQLQREEELDVEEPQL